MPEFPVVPDVIGLKVPRMGLREYALFSERCLKSNPAITPANCMVKRASEKLIKKPFRMRKDA